MNRLPTTSTTKGGALPTNSGTNRTNKITVASSNNSRTISGGSSTSRTLKRPSASSITMNGDVSNVRVAPPLRQQHQQLQERQQQQQNQLQHHHQDYCDICWGRPKKKGMTFQKCSICHVGIHNECYGILPHDTVYENFICYACAAVNTTVSGVVIDRKRIETSSSSSSKHQHKLETRTITIKKRPTECCLCSVDDGTDYYHAMHPLYHKEGKEGKHVILLPDEKRNLPYRLAWAHSLCCYAICSHSNTSGCVFGCTIDGVYEGDGNEDDDDDDNNNNEMTDTSIHHFVFTMKIYPYDKDSEWTKRVRECQKSLRCTICGSQDLYSYRIALQCSAGDHDEDITFKMAHTSSRNETCYLSMHVGCAIWGRNDVGELPNNRRVYFFPGLSKVQHQQRMIQGSNGNPKTDESLGLQIVTRVYCSLHASDLERAKVVGADIVRYPSKFNSTAAKSMHPSQSTIQNEPAISIKPQEKALQRNVPSNSMIHTQQHHSNKNRPANESTYASLATNPISKKVSAERLNSVAMRERSGGDNQQQLRAAIVATHPSNMVSLRERSGSGFDQQQKVPRTTSTTSVRPQHKETFSLAHQRLDRRLESSSSSKATIATSNKRQHFIVPSHLIHPNTTNTGNNPQKAIAGKEQREPKLIKKSLSDDSKNRITTAKTAEALGHQKQKEEVIRPTLTTTSTVEKDDDEYEDGMILETATNEDNNEHQKKNDLQKQTQQEHHQFNKSIIHTEEQLISMIVNEIVTIEERDGYHLDSIFQTSRQQWEKKLILNGDSNASYEHYTQGSFETLWDNVTKKCIMNHFPRYSLSTPTDWTTTSSTVIIIDEEEIAFP